MLIKVTHSDGIEMHLNPFLIAEVRIGSKGGAIVMMSNGSAQYLRDTVQELLIKISTARTELLQQVVTILSATRLVGR